MEKDICLALETGRELNVPLPSAVVTDGLLAKTEERGYARRDIAALFEVLARTKPAPESVAGPAKETDVTAADARSIAP
jgi:hypothetical protein